MLRHKTIGTTSQHYIGITREATARAMAAFEQSYAVACKQLPSGTSENSPSQLIMQSAMQSKPTQLPQVSDSIALEG